MTYATDIASIIIGILRHLKNIPSDEIPANIDRIIEILQEEIFVQSSTPTTKMGVKE